MIDKYTDWQCFLQMHLQQASDQANISTHQAEELKDRNENMARSIQELSTSLGQLQAKEQELVTTLNLKVGLHNPF